MKKQKQAYIFAFTAVLLWSTVATAFKLALRELDFIQLLFVASLFSTISLLLILLVSDPFKIFRPDRSGLIRSSLMGLINPLVYYLVLFKAYALLPAQEAQPLNWTWPITLSLFSMVFLKQKIDFIKLAAVVLSFLGVVIISTRGEMASFHFTDPAGDALAVGSSIFWAAYWIMNLKDKRDAIEKLFWNFFFGTIYCLPVLLFFTEFPNIRSFGFGAAIYIGFFEMGVTFWVWLKALSLSKNSASIGTFAYLTPFISLIFIHFVLNEKILTSSVIGLVLIMGGILLTAWRKQYY